LGPFLERKIASYTLESKMENACSAYIYVLLYNGAANPLPPLITNKKSLRMPRNVTGTPLRWRKVTNYKSV